MISNLAPTLVFDSFNFTSFHLNESLLLGEDFNLSISTNNTPTNESAVNGYSGTEAAFWALLLIPLPLVAVIGNILVILSVYKERSLQTVTNYFIVSLAFADLLVAAVVMPFAVYVLVNGDWELSDTLCDFYIAVDVTCSTASIFNLVAISIDRYIAVTHPISYSKHNKNNKRVIFTIVVVWVVSAAIGSPIVLGLNTSPERTPQLCVFYNSDFIIYSSLSSFYIPCLVMIFLYYKIFKAIHARAKKKLRAGASESGGGRSTGSTSLTTEPAKHKRPAKPSDQSQGSTSRGLQVVVEHDGMTTNTGSNSQDDDYDDDTAGEDSFRQDSLRVPTGASAMLLTAFMTETIRIEIPINGNTDSGYGTSHVEHETQFGLEQPSPNREDVGGLTLGQHLMSPGLKRNGLSRMRGSPSESDTSTGTKKKSRFNLGRRHKSSRKKREKATARKERKATKTLAIVLGMFLMCWVPFFTCNILDAICIKLNNDEWRPGMTVFLLTTWLGYINSCVNPVIYTIFNMEFRKAFKKLMLDSWQC